MKRFLYFFVLIPVIIFAQSDFEKAEKLFLAGKFEQSRPLFERIITEKPSDLKVLEYLGDIAGYNKSWDKAIVYYNRLRKLKPLEANYQYKYGGVLGMKAKESNKFKALGMIGEVKASFEKAIVLDPKHIEARWALIELYLQLPGIIGGSESKAVRYANELLKISPVDGYLARGHIDVYFERYEKAEVNYKIAYEMGHSKTTFIKLYDLYLNKLKDKTKANSLKEKFI
jgi:tetratricopeptide (TPR) repeat protein